MDRYRRVLFTPLDPRWSTSLLEKLIYHSRTLVHCARSSVQVHIPSQRRCQLLQSDSSEARGIYLCQQPRYRVCKEVDVRQLTAPLSSKETHAMGLFEARKCLAVDEMWMVNWYEPRLIERSTMLFGSPDIVKSTIFAMVFSKRTICVRFAA